MEDSRILNEITALVDNQIDCENAITKLKALIDSDKTLKNEYIIQSSIKNFIRSRLPKISCPAALAENILLKIKST